MTEENHKIRIVGFGASFRKGSFNLKLLNQCRKLMPDNSELEILDISGIPLYNQDLDDNQPESVRKFKNEIRSADGFLISTPEYDFSIPGYLKNTLDYCSRPPGENPFSGKVGAIMSASPSMLGGARAQYHLRQVLGFMDTKVINRPEVFISFAHNKFGPDGELKDEMAMDLIKQLLGKLVKTIKREKELEKI